MNTATRVSRPFSAAGPPGLIILLGPTGVGKTEVLERLFAAGPPGELPLAEIISADSRQVYRGLNIGAAKPPARLLARLPHHLLDIVDPREPFHAGEFVVRAEALCPEIRGRGRIPVISGGTGFYVRSFLYGMSGAPASQSAVREALRRRLELEGLAALYRELGQKDPVSAARISPNDAYRILRALEVYESSGAPLSSFPPPTMIRRDFKILLLALTRRRDELYARIDERVDQMFEAGLYREFLGLKERGYTALDPGLKSIGYREFFEMQSNGCLSLAGVKEKIRQNSRHYAKSQMTYFKGFKSEPIEWFDPGTDLDKIEKRIQLFFEEGD